MKNIKFTLFATCIMVAMAISACNNSNQGYKPDYDPDAQQLIIGDDIAIAQTQYGKVKGYISRGIYTFLGIPYGASTAGENRFMPPVAPEPWDNIRPAVWWGDSAPQSAARFSPESYGAFQDHWNYDKYSEDCLRLNVWTPYVDNEKRPVLVWFHGGGFSSGNGIEQDGYHGENFARRENVVFVSINHRLNCFGFSDFASVGGEKYRHSGNVGILDLIAALQWVKNNIANFGGDPNNITIMGQSGGGSKVCIVAGMPAAKGLVNRGVALSGSITAAANKEYAEGLGEAILKEAGLKAKDIDKLQQLTWQEYMELANRALTNYNKTASASGNRYRGFMPVADGVDILQGTFFSQDNANIPDIPMIFSTTTNENTSSRDNASLEKKTKAEIIEDLKGKYGENAEAIYNEYAQLIPTETPFGIYSVINSSRDQVLSTIEAKLHQKSPIYVAWFGWGSPNFNGRQRAFHCSDISFWFYNTDLMATHTGGGIVPRTLSAKMADALGAFMRTDNPNTGDKNGLPEWPVYNNNTKSVMMINNESVVVNDPDGKARGLMGL